jgi:hypothetical protein
MNTATLTLLLKKTTTGTFSDDKCGALENTFHGYLKTGYPQFQPFKNRAINVYHPFSEQQMNCFPEMTPIFH